MSGRNDPFEFLPPKISAWQRATSKYARGRLRTAGLAAAAVFVIVGGLFGFQYWRLSSLRTQWKEMEPNFKELKGVEKQITDYRPWFDNSFHYLSIMLDITSAFPDNGSVTAKTLEIRDWNTVNCSGNALSQTAFLETVHKLGAVKGVSDLLPQVRGKSPMQFTFDFKIDEKGVNENR